MRPPPPPSPFYFGFPIFPTPYFSESVNEVKLKDYEYISEIYKANWRRRQGIAL